MLVVELAYKRTGCAFAGDFVTVYLHAHLWQLALRTANVFLDEFV